LEEKQKQGAVLSDFLVKKVTIAALEAREAKDVLEEMTAALVKAGKLKEAEARTAVKTLLAREKQGSTGIGGGCAIPHCALEGIDELIMMIGRSANGVEFGCVTGEKIRVFVLVIYPPTLDQARRTVLGRILHLCRTTNWLKFLKAAGTAREINDLVNEYDNEP
jgi:PTS system nitrogen regulatory IIA component